MEELICRCPRCATAFRITDAHLKSAHGAVRCGSCLSVFNGKENLVQRNELKSSKILNRSTEQQVKSDPDPKTDDDESWALSLLEEENEEIPKSETMHSQTSKSINSNKKSSDKRKAFQDQENALSKNRYVPRVFVSYSHDSPSHKEWVAELCTHLRVYGVETILDQWYVKYGQSFSSFMEDYLSSCDRIICVCTDLYIEKSNARNGGVGYEKQIMSTERLNDPNEYKIIPVVRNIKGDHNLPKYLIDKYYADFSDGCNYDKNVRSLVAEIFGETLTPPPTIGSKSFR